MSIFRPTDVSCPACNERLEISANESVNADRRADLRQAILDRSFQVEVCSKCGERFRLDPMFSYLHVAQGQWISAQPLSSLSAWLENESEAKAVFDNAYGRGAPESARVIGDSLRPRLVFGWAALREKLVVADCGLDDMVLEEMKLALIQGLGNVTLVAGNELRLEKMDGNELELHWIKAQTEEIEERLYVPRTLYDGIVMDPDAWVPIGKALTAGCFVDIQKLYLRAAKAVA